MSYGVTAIAVSLEEVQKAIDGEMRQKGLWGRLLGSSPNWLLKAVQRQYAWRFEQDEIYDDDEPTLAAALNDLLNGNPLHEAYGHKYAYALELLCSYLGESLDNSMWSAMRNEWADQIHQALIDSGVDEQIFSFNDHLMFRGPPVSIPEPGDFPFMGYLRQQEIPQAVTAMDSANLAALEDEPLAAVSQIYGWLGRCQELQCDLVCFYY